MKLFLYAMAGLWLTIWVTMLMSPIIVLWLKVFAMVNMVAFFAAAQAVPNNRDRIYGKNMW